MSNLDNADNNRGNGSAEEIPVVATIANFLAGMDFPKTKDRIVEYTQKIPKGNENKERQTQLQQDSQSYNHGKIVSILGNLPHKEYENMTDLSSPINEVKA